MHPTHILKGILAISYEPLVSIDIVGRKESSIIDAELTKVDGNLIKLVLGMIMNPVTPARLIDLCSVINDKNLNKFNIVSKIVVIAHDNYKPNLLDFLKEKKILVLEDKLLLQVEQLNF